MPKAWKYRSLQESCQKSFQNSELKNAVMQTPQALQNGNPQNVDRLMDLKSQSE